MIGDVFRFCDVGYRPTPESLLNFSGEASAGRFSGDGKTRFREIYDGKTMGGQGDDSVLWLGTPWGRCALSFARWWF